MIKFVFFLALNMAMAEKITPKVKVVPAITTRQILGTIVYEGSVPLTLEVDIPGIVYSSKKESCQIDDVECFFQNSMHYFYRNIDEDVSVLKNATQPHAERQIAMAAAAATGYFMGPAIRRITTSLFGDDGVEDKINVMHEDFKDVIKKTEDYSMEMNKVMEEAKKKIMDNNGALTQLEKSLKSSLKGIYHIIQAKSLNDQFHQGITDCLGQKFPVSIVPLVNLKTHLVALDTQLRQKNYRIALSDDDLSVYSKLTLTDCIIVDSVLKVVVNVPVVALDTKWALYEVTHNKFVYNGQVCEVWPSEAMFVAYDRTIEKIVMITGNILRHCSPYNDKICLVPRFSRDSQESLHCVKTMLKNEPIEYLKAHCGFRCYDDTSVEIKQTSEGTLLITNAENVTMYCGNNHYEFDIPKIGSLELSLGCGCNTYVNELRLDNPLSCIDKGYYVHDHLKLSIPNVWTKLDNLLQGSKSEHVNHTEILDDTWHSRVPVLNFTSRADAFETDNTGLHVSFVLAGVITCFVLVACCLICKQKRQVNKILRRSEIVELLEA